MANWYKFIGANPIYASQYTLIGTEPACNGTSTICAILASAGGPTIPKLTQAIKDEMLVALNGHSNTVNVRLHG